MPRKSVAVVGIGVGLEDILKKNQRELFISMLFQCYLKITHLHIHVHKNIYIIKIYNNTTNQISYSDT